MAAAARRAAGRPLGISINGSMKLVLFDIDGTPVITLGSPLPAVSTPTVIDGTSQAGGWVEVVGGGTATIELGAGTSRVTCSSICLAYVCCSASVPGSRTPRRWSSCRRPSGCGCSTVWTS